MQEHGDTITMVSKMSISQIPVSKTGFSALNCMLQFLLPLHNTAPNALIHADAVSSHYFPNIQLNNEYEAPVTSHPTFALQNIHSDRQGKRIYA